MADKEIRACGRFWGGQALFELLHGQDTRFQWQDVLECANACDGSATTGEPLRTVLYIVSSSQTK